jgi:hypothetical protein
MGKKGLELIKPFPRRSSAYSVQPRDQSRRITYRFQRKLLLSEDKGQSFLYQCLQVLVIPSQVTAVDASANHTAGSDDMMLKLKGEK